MVVADHNSTAILTIANFKYAIFILTQNTDKNEYAVFILFVVFMIYNTVVLLSYLQWSCGLQRRLSQLVLLTSQTVSAQAVDVVQCCSADLWLTE